MDKLCTACKHSTPRFSQITLCLHPNNIIVSKVDGQPEVNRSCSALRESSQGCGSNAAWFESK